MIAVDGKMIEQKTFPDGTPNLLDVPVPHVGQRHIDITWCFDGMEELATIYMIASHYRDTYPDLKRNLNMPYVPNARMDRVKNTSECFTLKYMCQMINSLEFERVDVFDPHSDITAALLDRVHVIEPTDAIARSIEMEEPNVICFPDAGSQKRYEKIAGGENLEVIVGTKVRDWKTGQIKSYEMSRMPGMYGRVLIVDDISSYGGTFDYARSAMCCDRMDELSSGSPREVALYVSHCEKSIFEGKLFAPEDAKEAGEWKLFGLPKRFRLYTTDSILHPDDVPDEYKHRVFFVKRFRDVECNHPTEDEMREITSA